MIQDHKNPYSKPILKIQEQIDLYKQRDLIIDNEDEFSWYLKNVWYYAIGIYVKHFQDPMTNKFLSWTTSSQIIDLYNFDKELRKLVFDYIQIIEHSFKTALIREIWEKLWGVAWSFWHIDHLQFSCSLQYFDDTVIKFLKNIIEKYKNINDTHYSNKILDSYFSKKYDQELPPIRMMMQVMSFGESIRFYKMLRTNNMILIWSIYDITALTLKWWLYNLNNLRNKCAHWERIWNEYFVSSMKIPDKLIWWISYKEKFIRDRRKLYDYIIVIDILIKQIGIKKSLLQDTTDLCSKNDIETAEIGFPSIIQ